MPSAYPLFGQTANANTWLAQRTLNDDHSLPMTVTKTFVMSPSLAGVSTTATQNPSTTAIFYDIEHWTSTPTAEQQQPVASIAQAAQIVHVSGQKFGLVPDGSFMGMNGSHCTGDINAGIVKQIDWTQVDVLNIQAQVLASNTNCAAYGVANYTNFVTSIVQYVRAQNPNIVIWSQVSLRDSTPDWAINAATSVRGLTDATFVAYPAPCTNCTLADYTTLIQAL